MNTSLERSDGSQPVFVIFGASGGIGSALARGAAARGARLVLAARGEERLKELAGELDALALPADASGFDEVERVVDKALERFDRVDGIACCVGSLLLKPAHLTTEAEYQDTIARNLTAAFGCVRAAGNAMKEGGSVALVSTAASRLGFANHEAIAAAKGGIQGLVLSAAATYGPRSIRVNAVAPGLVRTGLTKKLTSSDAAEKASLNMHALGRLGEPEDVASALLFLLDPAQSWITGQVLGVDGGLGSVRTRR